MPGTLQMWREKERTTDTDSAQNYSLACRNFVEHGLTPPGNDHTIAEIIKCIGERPAITGLDGNVGLSWRWDQSVIRQGSSSSTRLTG